MQTLAIIGTGIAGMGCAYFLRERYDLTMFEQSATPGGHTNTITIDEDGAPVHIDTGFMVYNEVTYPNLTRLFRELEIPTMPTSMSFSVQHVPSGLEYCGSGWNSLFAQRKNVFRPSYYRFLRQIHRFNTDSPEVLTNERFARYTLNQYVTERGYGSAFLHKYLVPMSSAVWSTPPDKMLNFPARALVQFFKNHGFLGLHAQLEWRTVVEGSRVYRDRILAPFAGRVRCNRAVRKILREDAGATLVFQDDTRQTFDRVIIATHADQALAMLERPTLNERNHLAEFTYQKNVATLHTDSSVMPRNRGAWASWNYRMSSDERGVVVPSTVYYMNGLQKVSKNRDYFISINDPGDVDPGRILRTIAYEHPLYSLQAIDAQHHLWSLNIGGPCYYCGSYFGYGFHEDALSSALAVCRQITGEKIWS